MDNLSIFILSLQNFKGIGPATILKHLKSVEDFDSLLSFSSLSTSKEKKILKLIDSGSLTPTNWSEAIDYEINTLKKCNDLGIKVLNYRNKCYPQKLLKQKKYPLIIYLKGSSAILNSPKSVAIIGTREPTNFGIKMNERISNFFYQEGYTVISGLAKGHDTIAHTKGINTTGKTIAILAHGLDLDVYPKENQALSNNIIENGGAIISSYKIGQKLLPQNLVERDEWQTSMSDGVIAIETGIKGGTNHAINHAIKQNKPVGMLNHSAHKKFSDNDLNNTSQIQGNIKRINDKEVFPLYDLNSIKKFDDSLKEYAQEYLSKPIQKNSDLKENKKNNTGQQLSLFNIFDD